MTLANVLMTTRSNTLRLGTAETRRSGNSGSKTLGSRPSRSWLAGLLLLGIGLATPSVVVGQDWVQAPVNPDNFRAWTVRRQPAVSPYVHLERSDFHVGVPFYHMIVRDAQAKKDAQLARLAIRDKSPAKPMHEGVQQVLANRQAATLHEQLGRTQLNQPTLDNPYVQERIRQIQKLNTAIAARGIVPKLTK